MVANGAETLTFVLPERIRIRDLSAADTLVDLALRVLPTVARAAMPPPAPTAPADHQRAGPGRSATRAAAGEAAGWSPPVGSPACCGWD